MGAVGYTSNGLTSIRISSYTPKNIQEGIAEIICEDIDILSHPIVNCRPLQLSPGPGGEDGYICPNDLMMGRSDKKPALGPFEVSKLTKKVCGRAVLGQVEHQLFAEVVTVSEVEKCEEKREAR